MHAVAATRTNGGAWQLVTIDDGNGYKPPATAATNGTGFAASAVAAGPAGFVAVGSAGFYVGNYAKGEGGLVWFSADGITWQRIDVRPAIANLDPSGLRITQVGATATGYVVVGGTGRRVFALRSTDGISLGSAPCADAESHDRRFGGGRVADAIAELVT